MARHLSIALRMAVVTIVVLGLAYPLAMTGIAQVAFRGSANGSLVAGSEGTPVGSALIGQSFTAAKYFHGRPSANDYDGAASGGTNLGPTSKALQARVSSAVDTAVAENPGLTKGAVPIDMVTASASGLDPDISVANALAQTARVAKERGMSEGAVRQLVDAHTASRQLGFLGEPRVNVLELNLALDGKR
jgi:potassium-transporting ATPase KdpC subunit